MLTAENSITPNPARALYENFMIGEYGKKWDDLPAGVQKRWADALAAGVIAMTSVRIEPVEDFDTEAFRAASLQPGTIAVLPEPTEIIFSDGEPYAAMTVDYLGCEYLSRDVENIEKIAAAGSKGPTEVVYLFHGTRSKSLSPKPVEPLALPYKNWRGEISKRKILPIRLEFGATEWHPEPQWLLVAKDIEKNAERSFALKDFNPPQPAQSLAVKALADAYQKYMDAVSLYNERHAIMKTKAVGTMRVDEEYKAIDETRRAFDKLAVDVATSALSAQVQDMAGWQDDEKLTPEQAWKILCETPDITSPEEYPDHALITFEHLQSYMERANVPDGWQIVPEKPTQEMLQRGADSCCSLTVHGAYGVYRAMLPAAPAKQEGSNNG